MLFMITKNGRDLGIRESNGVFARTYWSKKQGCKLVPLDDSAKQFLDGFDWLDRMTAKYGIGPNSRG